MFRGIFTPHAAILPTSVAAALVVIMSVVSCPAAENTGQGGEPLKAAYRRHEAALRHNSFGFPLVLESSDKSGLMHADVYGVVEHPFQAVSDILRSPENWCAIAFLNPSVKACTHRKVAGEWRLVLYIGRKVSPSPEDARQYAYSFRCRDQRPDYLDVTLSAKEGPFSTKDHHMRFEAMPLEDGRTFVRVGYSYKAGLPVRLAGTLYFAILGGGRDGFTVTGKDGAGSPVYIGGQRAALERNVVRYYLAVRSFMDTLQYPEENRFGMRVGAWYDLTLRFKRQLFDMERKDYIAAKTEEQKMQWMLQSRVAAGP